MFANFNLLAQPRRLHRSFADPLADGFAEGAGAPTNAVVLAPKGHRGLRL
jgi:hypothetical protein